MRSVGLEGPGAQGGLEALPPAQGVPDGVWLRHG